MSKIYTVLAFVAVFLCQSAFAEEEQGLRSKPCATIAKACSKAGFTRVGAPDKQFWKSCMRPILLGQTVRNVAIDSDTAKACRADKITQLKKELDTLQKVS